MFGRMSNAVQPLLCVCVFVYEIYVMYEDITVYGSLHCEVERKRSVQTICMSSRYPRSAISLHANTCIPFHAYIIYLNNLNEIFRFFAKSNEKDMRGGAASMDEDKVDTRCQCQKLLAICKRLCRLSIPLQVIHSPARTHTAITEKFINVLLQMVKLRYFTILLGAIRARAQLHLSDYYCLFFLATFFTRIYAPAI